VCNPARAVARGPSPAAESLESAAKGRSRVGKSSPHGYLLKSWEHGFQRQGVAHGPLHKLTLTRAAWARPGPTCLAVPRRPRSSAALRLPTSVGPHAGSPGQWPPSMRTRVSGPREANDTCARQRVVRRRRVTGSPLNRDGSRRGAGLPGCEAISFVRAVVEHPAGYGPPPRPSGAGDR
jgi:hypothetical protein